MGSGDNRIISPIIKLIKILMDMLVENSRNQNKNTDITAFPLNKKQVIKHFKQAKGKLE